MNPIEFVVKLLAATWPFVKEMVLEGHSLKHALVFDRRRAIFGIVIMLSFFFNVVNMGADARVMRVMMNYVKLQKDYKALKKDDEAVKLTVTTPVACKAPVVTAEVVGATVPPESVQTGDAGYQLTRSTFAQLNAQH